MALASSKFPGSKEIVKIGIVSILACAIIISTTWMQLIPYFSTVVYIIVLALVAPLVSLYLDRKNPLVNDCAKSTNIEKVMTILGLVGTTTALSIMSIAVLHVRSYNASDVVALIIIIIAPLVSFYFDYFKNLAAGDLAKNARLTTVMLGSVLGVLVITTLYVSVPSLPFNLIMTAFPLAVVFIAPLVSLYFDYKNPVIGVKNRKFSRNKAIITIAIGFLVIIAILLTAFLNLMLYL